MFSYVSVEDRVPADHPIRKLRVLVDTILGELDALLAMRHAEGGRLSIPPERILRASQRTVADGEDEPQPNVSLAVYASIG